MKKLFALALVVLGLAACQTEPNELDVNVGGEVTTTVNISIPETTRATDSAKGAFENVDFAKYTIRYILQVYYNGEPSNERLVEYSDGNSVTFDVRLVSGRDYQFVAWADLVKGNNFQKNEWSNAHGIHYNTEHLHNITLKDTWVAMDETRDAFTATKKVNYSSTATIDLTLTRPFAKLRVITTDMEALNNIDIKPTKATVEYAVPHYNAFNAFEGKAIGDSKNRNIKHEDFDIVSYGEGVENGADMTLFTDYFFAENDDVVKFYLTVFDQNNAVIDETIAFNTDINVKRNYVTTISGNILTDRNNVKVDIHDAFYEPEHTENMWDGMSVSEPAYDETTKTYTVKNGAELAWIADQVNGVTRAASNNFQGKIIVLANNINLGGNEWTPIGGSGKYFEGTFDGGNFVVEDFQVTRQDGHAGLFGNARATIKNLTVKDVKIVSHHYAGAIVGQGYAKIENCHVNNIDITLTTKNGDWGDKAGGIIGQNCEGGMYVKKSTAQNVKIQGYRDLGGIAGMAHNNNRVSDCAVENITILQDLSVNYEDATPTTLGGVVGRKGSNVTDENNTESNVEISVIITEGLSQNLETEAYTVTSAEGLQTFAEMVENENEVDADILLGGDIDLSELVLTRAETSNWIPVGTSEKPFTGTFNGRGYTIKNLTLVESEAKEGKAYVGFFGYAKNATIKNVTFENVYINIPCLDIDHSQGHIGAVAGSLEGKSTIENVTVKGDIKVEATVTANGASRVAVVAGGNSYGNVTIKNVHVEASEGSYLKANNNVGAIAGQLQGKTVYENCSSNIDVTGTKFFAGGIVGLAGTNDTFTNCHTTGNITITAGREGRANDHYRVGGIAGGWSDGAKNTCVLTNCTYTGNVSGTNSDGSVANPLDYAGYVGRGYTLTNCAGSKVVIDGVAYIQKYDNVYGVYVDENGYDYIADGLRQNDKEYVVLNANGLVALAEKGIKAGDKVLLGADIDLAGVEFNGLNTFHPENNNTFDGQDYTVSNWTNNSGASDMGFIRNWVGTIKNVKFENCHLKTSGRSAIAAAKVYGNIENVTINNCSLEDSYWACGLVAGLYNAGNISGCTVTNSSIKSNGGTGAIVGVINESAGTRKVENCKVEGCTVNNTGAYGETYSGALICGMINISDSTVEFNGCSFANNSKEGKYVGDLYYSADEDVTVTIDGK